MKTDEIKSTKKDLNERIEINALDLITYLSSLKSNLQMQYTTLLSQKQFEDYVDRLTSLANIKKASLFASIEQQLNALTIHPSILTKLHVKIIIRHLKDILTKSMLVLKERRKGYKIVIHHLLDLLQSCISDSVSRANDSFLIRKNDEFIRYSVVGGFYFEISGHSKWIRGDNGLINMRFADGIVVAVLKENGLKVKWKLNEKTKNHYFFQFVGSFKVEFQLVYDCLEIKLNESTLLFFDLKNGFVSFDKNGILKYQKTVFENLNCLDSKFQNMKFGHIKNDDYNQIHKSTYKFMSDKKVRVNKNNKTELKVHEVDSKNYRTNVIDKNHYNQKTDRIIIVDILNRFTSFFKRLKFSSLDSSIELEVSNPTENFSKHEISSENIHGFLIHNLTLLFHGYFAVFESDSSDIHVSESYIDILINLTLFLSDEHLNEIVNEFMLLMTITKERMSLKSPSVSKSNKKLIFLIQKTMEKMKLKSFKTLMSRSIIENNSVSCFTSDDFLSVLSLFDFWLSLNDGSVNSLSVLSNIHSFIDGFHMNCFEEKHGWFVGELIAKIMNFNFPLIDHHVVGVLIMKNIKELQCEQCWKSVCEKLTKICNYNFSILKIICFKYDLEEVFNLLGINRFINSQKNLEKPKNNDKNNVHLKKNYSGKFSKINSISEIEIESKNKTINPSNEFISKGLHKLLFSGTLETNHFKTDTPQYFYEFMTIDLFFEAVLFSTRNVVGKTSISLVDNKPNSEKYEKLKTKSNQLEIDTEEINNLFTFGGEKGQKLISLFYKNSRKKTTVENVGHSNFT